MRVISVVVRLVMIVVWTFVFYGVGYVGLRAAYVQPRAEAEQPDNPKAGQEAMRPYAVPVFGGSLVLAIALKLLGVLPGAGRRKRGTATAPETSAETALPTGEGERLPPEGQPGFLDTVIMRLIARGFDVSTDRRGSSNLEYASLQPSYLCAGKRLRYSPLSLIGALEEDVFVAAHGHVNVETMRLLAGRAVVDARAGRSYFHGIFPVVYQYVFAVIVADEVASDLEEHFRRNSAPFDKTALVLPVVYHRATGKIDYYRKVPLFGSGPITACLRRAKELFAP